jgi:protein unc-80
MLNDFCFICSRFIECFAITRTHTHPYTPVTLNVRRTQADASLFLQQSTHGRQEAANKATMFLKDKYDKNVTKFDFDKIEYDKVNKSTVRSKQMAPKTFRICFRSQKLDDSKPKTSSSTEKESLETDPKSPQCFRYDVTAATFLDVAVLRCLFVSHWQEEGIYWSLHYLYNR